MRKDLFLFISFLLIANLAMFGENTPKGEVKFMEAGYHFMGISPNGQYVAGQNVYTQIGVLWTEEGIIELGNTISTAYAVANDGTAAGIYSDENYKIPNSSGNFITLDVAASYKDGEWRSFGIREEIELRFDAGGYATAISADGTIVGGGMENILDGKRFLEPTIWKNFEPEGLESNREDGRVTAMSGDGSILGGWIYMGLGTGRNAVLWIDGELIPLEINNQPISGEVNSISNNGKYVGVQINGESGAIYNTETKEFIFLGNPPGTWGGYVFGISDNGIAVGSVNGMWPGEIEGFIYSEKTGSMLLSDYLERLDIDAQGMIFESVQSISADGSRIAVIGYGSMPRTGCIIDIYDHMDEFNPAKNPRVVENGRGNILLTWEAAGEEEGFTLEGYNIYRNDTKINDILLPADVLAYNDIDLPNGNYEYQIVAIWEENKESRRTDAVKINIGTVSLPFYDGFDSESMDTYFWNTELERLSYWSIREAGYVVPCMVMYAPRNTEYAESVFSPYIDATEASDLYLSFTLRQAETLTPNNHTLSIEVFDGNDWQEVDKFHALASTASFDYKKIDISDIAVGKITRIRFKAEGRSETNEIIIWYVDNVMVYKSGDEFQEAEPLNVSVFKNEDGSVSLSWGNPGGMTDLSYYKNIYVNDFIGNEGEPFMVANRFDEGDLQAFDGYKLKNITAFLYNEPGSYEATYKLVAFSGDEQILEQDIISPELYEWNTFEIERDIIIDASKPFYYGIEIVNQHQNDRPVTLSGVDGTETNGKSNLYSLDGGKTWNSLKDDFGFGGSHSLKASIVKDENATEKYGLLGYRIYRDNIELLGNDMVTIANTYTDYDLPVGTHCYQIGAHYYITNGEIKSNEICITITGIENVENTGKIQIYPNPASEELNISGDFKNVYLLDIESKLIMETSNSKLDISKLSTGIYLLKIETEQGIETKKVIKK